MAKVRTIVENLKVENRNGTNYWGRARMEYEHKTTALCNLDKKVLVPIGEMMNRTMQAEGNFVFSPVALYLALISLAKITDGNTKKQIVEMLGITEKDLLSVYGTLQCVASNATPMVTSSISSSLWINDRMDYDEEDTIWGSFYLPNSSEVRCKFMNQWILTAYHIGTKFTAITKVLNDGYDAIFILPNEGIGIDEVIHDVEWCQLATTGRLNTTKQMQVDFSMPKYDISTKLDLKNVMKSFGITDVFDSTLADFTPISTISEVFLEKAEQTTRFKVNEQGIEADSCVEFGAVVAGIPPRLDEVKFVLDRPFVFMVVSRGTIPVFVGKVKNPCEK